MAKKKSESPTDTSDSTEGAKKRSNAAASSGNALRIGIVITGVTLGPQLLPLLTSGSLDLTTAFYRAAIVSIGLGMGAFSILRLIDDYRAQQERQRKVDATMAQIAALMREHGTPAEPRPEPRSPSTP